MKANKKYILAALLIILISCSFVSANSQYNDVQNHWASAHIINLSTAGTISGYPDGSFGPDNAITVAEFNVLALKAMDVSYGSAPSGQPWYMGSINESISRSIIRQGEFGDYNRSINRGEMARIIVCSMGQSPTSGNTSFSDNGSIPASVRGYVKRASDLGIISGYPDGSFGASRNATRAEASVMIAKMVDLGGTPPPAVVPEVGKKTTSLSDADIQRLQAYPFPWGKGALFLDFYEVDEHNRIGWTNRVNGEFRHLYEYIPLVSAETVFRDPVGSTGLRGIAQKQENGKWYEADATFYIEDILTTEGRVIRRPHPTEIHSQWREVQ